jgi:predicted adenine nucleotide alpha hydrolase (AANH) superfamily ATPase
MAPEYQVTGYFHNPNIAPPEEYTKRLQETERVAMEMGFLLEPAPFLPEAWDEAVRGYEDEPEGGERCFHCFRHNLRATAQKARELGIERITTTLTISPHKKSAKVFAAGREAAQEFGVEFLEMDFKKQNGFKRSLELCKAMNVYRQNYCGCKYSQRKSGSD